MPWRLIGFIILFAIFLVFIGFNLENNCNISFGFKEVERVPVYLTAFASFVFGMLCTIPFAVFFRVKKKQKASKAKVDDKTLIGNPEMSQNTLIDASKPESKRKSKKESVPTEINPSDYGIN
jgi:uncharacterized integral membrane protein